jgi:hypothetical protein
LLYLFYDPRRPDAGVVFQVQTTLLLIILILWYFFGALSIEEKLVHELRGLSGRCASLEFLVRVMLFVLLEVSEVLLASHRFRPPGTTETVFSLAVLYFITFCFMAWDIIVDAGGRTDIAWQFFKYDAILAVSALTCLVAAMWRSEVACAVTIFFTGGAATFVIMKQFSVLQSIATRLCDRKKLR